MEYSQKDIAALVKNLEKRNMEGHYFSTIAEAKSFLFSSLLEKNSSIGFGGSMTFEKDMNLYQELKGSKDYHFLDRYAYQSEEQIRQLNAEMINADYFFLSANAITKDGILLNIDGRGNRLSFLMYGPKNVICLVGINKICDSLSLAYERVKKVACSKNAIRLKKNTPCAITGICNDCFSPDCICSSIVVTRRSHIKNRIKVILIGEELGY